MLKPIVFATFVLCAGCGETPEEKAARETRQINQEAERARSQRHEESMKKWYAENPDSEAARAMQSSSQPSSVGLTKDQIRVLRENHSGDDSSREHVFRAQINALGQRCDSVNRAIMGGPGEWTISCAPGYDYRLSYDEAGKPTRAQRAQ